MGALPRKRPRRRAPGAERAGELRDHYGLELPDELYWLWGFCLERAPDRPRAALEAAEIRLCGPFDVLAGDADGAAPPAPLVMHWRFYLDPPEFFTVATGHTDGLHWGLWFDAPGQRPPVVASYYSRDAYEITEHGPSLFATFGRQLLEWIEDRRAYIDDDPDYADDYRREIDELSATLEAMKTYRADNGITLPRARALARRPTFDRMGLWVDDDPTDLVGEPRALWQRADRGDGAALLAIAESALADRRPGAALLVARAVWTFEGSKAHHRAAAELASRCYEALGRPALAAVSRAQMEHRDQPSVGVI